MEFPFTVRMPKPATLPRHVQYTSKSAVAVLVPEARSRSSNQGTSVTTKYLSGSEVKLNRTPPTGSGRHGFGPDSSDQCTCSVTRSEEHTSELQSRQYLVCR